MLNFTPTQTTGVYNLTLDGAITENIEFKGEVPAGAIAVDVQCSKISRINSMGITKWILFFRELRKRGVNLRYFDLPVSVVNLCNFVSGMVEPGEVQSLHLPFFCERCNTETEVLRTVESLRTLMKNPEFTLDPITCPNCKTPAAFDGVPKNFLDFLIP